MNKAIPRVVDFSKSLRPLPALKEDSSYTGEIALAHLLAA